MSKQGGAREGAGRKKKYKNPATIGFVIEQEDKDKLTQKYGSYLRNMFRDWIKDLLK